MRIAIAAALAVIATPALAQYAPPPAPIPAQDRYLEETLAERLNDPMVQMGTAAALAGVVGSLMDMRVGPLASLGLDVSPNDTLRDLNARRGGDPYPEARIYRDSRAAAAGMGRMADGVAVMMPELRATIARLSAQIEQVADAYEY